jgi:hypothetical protein
MKGATKRAPVSIGAANNLGAVAVYTTPAGTRTIVKSIYAHNDGAKMEAQSVQIRLNGADL